MRSNTNRYTLEQLGFNNFFDFLEMKEEFCDKEDGIYRLISSLSDRLFMVVRNKDILKIKKVVRFYYKPPGFVIHSPTYILDEKEESNHLNAICASNKHELKVLIEYELTEVLTKENAPEIAMIEKQELEEILIPNNTNPTTRRI